MGLRSNFGAPFLYVYKAQIKHIKNFSINNFGPPMTPPPRNSLCLGFVLYLEGKGGPKHKEFTGSGSLERAPEGGRGVSGEILYVCAFFGGLRSNFGGPFLYVYVLFWGLTVFGRCSCLAPLSNACGRPEINSPLKLESKNSRGMRPRVQSWRPLERLLGNENLAQSFSDRSFWKSLRVVDVRAFESCMSAPKCLVSRV